MVAPLTVWVFEISAFIAWTSFGLAVKNERCLGACGSFLDFFAMAPFMLTI